MNSQERPENQDTYKSLLLLDEISKGKPVSQRDLSKRLNIALGLVNSYIKNLVSKGYITIKAIPTKRYAYFLTPKGFAEKTRLTYHHLQNFTNLYREARRDFQHLFQELREEGVRRIVFAGADEVAEIAYLSLKEADLRLTGVLDNDKKGNNFFGVRVRAFDEIKDMDFDRIIVAHFMKAKEYYNELLKRGVLKEKIVLYRR
ncbi:MAG: winged helix-turn-helix transcriptional regulator [Nitrospira sp.]|nr:winged helix-turn-helix transcriptional regulator [Nitrospira sp.]